MAIPRVGLALLKPDGFLQVFMGDEGCWGGDGGDILQSVTLGRAGVCAWQVLEETTQTLTRCSESVPLPWLK